jgi:hypothetical protein
MASPVTSAAASGAASKAHWSQSSSATASAAGGAFARDPARQGDWFTSFCRRHGWQRHAAQPRPLVGGPSGRHVGLQLENVGRYERIAAAPQVDRVSPFVSCQAHVSPYQQDQCQPS